MIYGAVRGMVDSVGDPYTVFFDPKEAKTFLEDVNGKFEGVGIEIGVRDGQIKVIAPLEGTPAKKAGLLPGDAIVRVNDTLTSNITIEKVVNLIRGPKGTFVTLGIMREGWEEPKDFKIKRAVIKVPSLEWKLISSKTGEEDKNGDIAYINLYEFSEKAGFDFKRAAAEILKSPAEKIIIDLRGNPGGYLEVAQDIAGWFLKQDQVVVMENFGREQRKEVYRARGSGKFLNYPVVILINQGSASASEILASALRDNREDVRLVGETSFGKGSVQELRGLRDGSNLKITVAHWLTPKGDLIDGKGLSPDVEVEMEEEDYKDNNDIQLKKAIEVINKM